MGRWDTGAFTTGEAVRLELSYLIKAGYVNSGERIHGAIGWTNGSTIAIESNLTGENRYIRLNYNNESWQTGDISQHDYYIQLTSIPSNLGIGQIWYFICPVTGNRARILYKCYGSQIFKCRKAYRHRIYYSCQQASKFSYHNTRYWDIERTLKKLYKTATKEHYRGKQTRIQQRILNLESKLSYHDEMRYLIMPVSLKKCFTAQGFK